MRPVDETHERFLKAIAQRVGDSVVEELHVFQPIRNGGMESGVAVVAVTEPPVSEHRKAVYTATYRLQLKGPERGKWEFAFKPEADAPLVTVDKVVRGVQQRSGDAAEPTRLSGEELRQMVPVSPPPG